MGRAFEYRKASKMARWDKMAKTFSKIGKDIAIAVKAGGQIQILTLLLEDVSKCKGQICLKIM